MAQDILKVIDLQDPIGTLVREIKRPNGLVIQQIRIPLGVIGVIYESRPNVTVDIASLCIKTKLKCGEYEFCARPVGSRSLRAQYLADKEELIGMAATVQHQGYSDAGVPRFPVLLNIRDYE